MSDQTITGVPALALILLIWLGLLGMIWLGLLGRAMYRSCIGPRCWNCGSDRVRRSEGHGVLDTVARLSLLFPHRCSCCRKRFYRFHLLRPEAVRVAGEIRNIEEPH